ncbi:hypothetical protein SADO_02135 [Salinisphaera dokdonensis CL-ES53]|uniref:DUF2252 domain-containing protein n=1 Tax=Salinisphaera dokdonensis CL-ES53 TaxID=1304272 RepID=A0ABV2AWI9_9GAMM
MGFHFMRFSREELVLDEIDAHNRRLSRADRARKYEKMSRSPYRFFRGTNHLYWGDVWQDWRYYLFGGLKDTQTWLQGDAHVHNHGAYGDPRQGVHYGMDDFDDAVIGDYQYDLWRHAASMVLDAEENAGLSPDKTARAIRHLLTTYLDTLVDHADGRSPEDIHVKYIKKPLGPFIRKVMRKKGHAKHLAKWTTVADDGQRRFDLGKKKMSAVSAVERRRIIAALDREYPQTLQGGTDRPRSHFAVKDIARRLNAGTGSLGLARYYALIEGDSESVDDDIILDIKQQTAPPAYRFMNAREKRAWRQTFDHEAQRHALAFQALANHPDDYLGWITLGHKVYSVRQRSPYKKDFPTHKIDGFKQYRRLTQQWGRILAREHIRGAHALRPDDPAYFARAVLSRCDDHREAFKAMVVDLAFTYARCMKRDYRVFVAKRGVG